MPRLSVSYPSGHVIDLLSLLPSYRFIYQDIDLHGLDEFESLAPEAANTIDEHELMKNRLEFEFTERRRSVCSQKLTLRRI
jgi:hypothetical protein